MNNAKSSMLQLLLRPYRSPWSHQAQNAKYAIPVLYGVQHGYRENWGRCQNYGVKQKYIARQAVRNLRVVFQYVHVYVCIYACAYLCISSPD